MKGDAGVDGSCCRLLHDILHEKSIVHGERSTPFLPRKAL